ncbi:MAG: glycosyltransferase [Methanobacteriaceae archaeon]|nr:glycosyltransferase [Methanobacteriaceae archaeon]
MDWIIICFLLLILAVNKPKNDHKFTVSVVIPAFNEAATVGHVVKVVKSLDFITEVIVVDDGSEDETAKIAENAGAIVLKHDLNKGKGSALKTGFKYSRGDIVAFIDADLHKLTSKQVERMIQPIIDGKADITKTKFKREAGRVTELTAKPLLNFFFPEIKFDQPLSGQFAAKRNFLNNIKFEKDYGVDVGIVLDADVRGINIKEVDIGKIDHTLSSLKELNLVATEVVRTIMERAMEYGRVTMMDALGKYIRMGILGLSLATLGLFSLFFVRFVPPLLGIVITVFGMIFAIYYIIKLIRRSLIVIYKSNGRAQSTKSFLYMHFPILVSGLILIVMLTSFLGAVNVDEGKISIEPTSRNLIIWKQPSENRTFDIRGPYTVDSALENEYNILRVPKSAIDTLGLNYNDSIYIKDFKYSINQTRPGEDNILRVPAEARSVLGIAVGDVIPDSNLRNIFKELYAEKTLKLEGNNTNNLTINEGIYLKTDNRIGKSINIYLDDEKISSSSGVFKNDTYGIYVNGELVRTIKVNVDDANREYYVYWGSHLIRIEIINRISTDMEFATFGNGRFLNFILKN